jgi:integrase
MKKIRRKIFYFGRWAKIVNGKLERIEGDGWESALADYKAQADDLHAGRTPRAKGDELTVMDLCNRFLTAKQRQLEAGEIGARMFKEYRGTTDRLIATFSKTRLVDDLAAEDFEALRADIAKEWGPVRLGNEVQKVRTVFKYGYDAGLIEKPVRYGPQFVKPSKSVMRKHRATNGNRMFDAAEIRALLDVASSQLKAMILLGINGGFGNHDCGALPSAAVDLERGWIRFPRPKTGVARCCPLWPETVEALRTAIAERPTPSDSADADLVFVTKYGHRWVRTVVSTVESEDESQRTKHTPVDSVGLEFGKLLRELKLNRPGRGFYALRHTHRTIADATRDFPAVRLIMGHADASIDDVYREHIDDARLKSVTDHVRAWLFPKPAEAPADKPTEPERGEAQATAPESSAEARPMLRLFAG